MKIKNISLERKKYLSKIKKQKILVFITQMLILIGFLAIWEILANANIIDSFITSKPSRIFNTFMNLSQNDLLKHIWVTSYETIVRIFNWDLFGNIYCNFIMVVYFFAKVSEPFLVVLNSLPKVALRTSYYNLGGGRNSCNYCYGRCNFSCCNYIRKFKWIFKN